MPKERFSFITDTDSASSMGANEVTTLVLIASGVASPETVLADTRQASTRATAIIFVIFISKRSRLRSGRTGTQRLAGEELTQ